MTMATATAEVRATSETRTLVNISLAHLVSHFYIIVFVPLLPLLKSALQVSYVELGFAITVYNIVSLLTQAPTGFLVDRFGARRLLVAGLVLGGSALIFLGIAPSYPALVATGAVLGLANAVYHPADYSILSSEMSAARMGRAYSVHSFTGYLGFAIAPPVLIGLSSLGGLRGALIAAGLVGPVTALLFLPDLRRTGPKPKKHEAPKVERPMRSLMTPTVLWLTLMFVFVNLSTNMLQTFVVPALTQLWGLPHAIGNTSLTVFLFALVGGILLGGFLADRVRSQSFVAAAGFTLSAALVAIIGSFDAGATLAIVLFACAGFLAGIIMPSRDMLVRAASPPDATGRVFGIVTTGFNLGGMVGPLIGGALLDHKASAWIFYGSAIFMLATVAVALFVDNRPQAHFSTKA